MNDDHETDPLPSFGSVGFDDWWKGQGLDGGSPGMLSSGQPSDLEQSPYVSFSLVTGSSAYMQDMHQAPYAPIAPHPRGHSGLGVERMVYPKPASSSRKRRPPKPKSANSS
jgi:hypothetical protein